MAATERSGPVPRSITWRAAVPSRESGSFVIAIVNAPCSVAAATTDATSGDAPDCEIPITSASS